MTIDLAHYNFKLQLNKVDSATRKDFNSAEIDEFLNKALLIWVESCYSGRRNNASLERSQQRIDNLRTLVVKSPSRQAALTSPSVTDNIYEFSFSMTDYLHLLNARLKVDGCTDFLDVFIVQHDDINQVLRDPYRKPSLDWKRAVGILGKGSTSNSTSLFVYSEGVFTPTELYPEYIKKPVEVSIGGYNDITGSPKSVAQFDIPDEYHQQVIDIAVRLASAYLDQNYQIHAIESVSNE